jgi:hypothetical protein
LALTASASCVLEVSESRFFLGVAIDQSAADFHVERHRRARTHLFKPLPADVIRKSPKAKHRHVNRPPFTRPRLDEISAAAGAVMLAERLVGIDLYLAGFRTRPLMAVPCGAVQLFQSVASEQKANQVRDEVRDWGGLSVLRQRYAFGF